MNAPICSKYPLDALPGGQCLLLHFDDKIQHGKTFSVCSTLFTQRRSHQLPRKRALFEAIGQSNDSIHLAPTPDTCRVWIAEAKPCHPCIQIHSQPVCLTFFAPI